MELKEAGNALFKKRDFSAASDEYTTALAFAPPDADFATDRAAILCNRAACWLQLERFQEVVDDCTAALELQPSYLKALVRRSAAYERIDKLDEALADAKAAHELDSELFAERIPELQRAVEARNERLKAEMMGKLKDMANMFLGKFGLSTDNFQMEKDPATGSYSMQFRK